MIEIVNCPRCAGMPGKQARFAHLPTVLRVGATVWGRVGRRALGPTSSALNPSRTSPTLAGTTYLKLMEDAFFHF